MRTIERKVSPESDYYLYTPSKTAEKLFFYPTQCGSFVYEPGYRLKRSAFDSFLLMYIQKGAMLLDFGGREQRVTENHFVLIDCYQPHGYSTESGYECLWMHFDGPLCRDYYNLIVSRMGFVFSMGDAFPVRQKMEAILRVFRENRQVREPLLSQYITGILTEFMLDYPENGRAGSHAEPAERAIAYINEHFSEELSVEQLSSVSGLSPYYFIRVFKQETGYTPHEYTVNRRMASARYLLQYTALSVKEICFSTGFSSESVFCNAFKKKHQMTPQQYRLNGTETE